MSDANPYSVFGDARTRIRDTAKWIVTILGSTIVLVIGGGLYANLPSLGAPRMYYASAALTALAIFCVVPLIFVIDILVSPFASFEALNASCKYKKEKTLVDTYLLTTQPTGLHSIDAIATKRKEVLAALPAAGWWDKQAMEAERSKVDALTREVVELASIRRLESRFCTFKRIMGGITVLVILCLWILLWALRKAEPAVEPLLSGQISDYSVEFDSGRACQNSGQYPDLRFGAQGASVSLKTLASAVRNSGRTRLQVIGSADSQRMGTEAHKTYGNDVSLALARATCVASALQAQLALEGIYIQTEVTVRPPKARVAIGTDRTAEIRLLP